MSRTICRLSSQWEQAGLRLIIGLSDLSQVFQCRRITYATLEDVTVAATVLRIEGNSRQGIELLNVSHQQQNACLEVPYLILKENKKYLSDSEDSQPFDVFSKTAGNEKQYH